MNTIYVPIWNDRSGAAPAVLEKGKSAGSDAQLCNRTSSHLKRFALNTLAGCLMLSFGAGAYALPQGGVVSAGGANISSGGSSTTITQTTQNAAINWQSFSIGAGQAVQFAQPNSSSVALNRVLGPNPSNILGSLSANGKVFLVNPNGVLFGSGASVNVGGLVASTLNMTDANLLAGKYIFSGPSSASVVNEGTINADGGYVALLGASVSNQGVISARLGSVALAAGNAMTLDMAGDKLLSVKVDQGAVNALVENGGVIQGDGGTVLMTAREAGNLLSSAVNNTGVVRAQTITSSNGTIKLAGGPVPASEVSNLALAAPAISFTGAPAVTPPTVAPTNTPPTCAPANTPAIVPTKVTIPTTTVPTKVHTPITVPTKVHTPTVVVKTKTQNPAVCVPITATTPAAVVPATVTTPAPVVPTTVTTPTAPIVPTNVVTPASVVPTTVTTPPAPVVPATTVAMPSTVVPASSVPVLSASYVVPTFSLPLIPQQVAGLPLVMTAFDSPAPVELVEVLPPQAPPVVEERPAPPVPYVAPVRRPKQDRH
jgi:filamentous hemagglutinin family protein